MAFRKRNTALSRAPTGEDASNIPAVPSIASKIPTPPGVRPSPIDGRPTTSTGTHSLDGILAGHAGLPLGTSIMIEESGTTDYAGALLRFYAAEGVVQGHVVHVVGMGEVWGRELPGISEGKEDKRREGKERAEKMKIAWRYEGLGQFESARGACGIYLWRNGKLFLHILIRRYQLLQVRLGRQVGAKMRRRKPRCSAMPLIWQSASRSQSEPPSIIFQSSRRRPHRLRHSHPY